MPDNSYQIIFSGDILEGRDRSDVKRKLQALLKLDAKGIELLFTGKPVVIRNNVPRETAVKFAGAFEKAGAVCRTTPPLAEPAGAKSAAAPPLEMAVGAPAPAPAPGRTEKSVDPSPGPRAPAPAPAPGRTPALKLQPGQILLTNIETVPGAAIVEHFGLVSGSTIRAKHIGRDLMASLKNIVGGELKGYTELLQESRNQAIERMMEQARRLRANAIVNVRFSTSSVAQGAAELYAYGTAVRIEPL